MMEKGTNYELHINVKWNTYPEYTKYSEHNFAPFISNHQNIQLCWIVLASP
jgi:Zn/Cd-binding protein ZinT